MERHNTRMSEPQPHSIRRTQPQRAIDDRASPRICSGLCAGSGSLFIAIVAPPLLARNSPHREPSSIRASHCCFTTHPSPSVCLSFRWFPSRVCCLRFSLLSSPLSRPLFPLSCTTFNMRACISYNERDNNTFKSRSRAPLCLIFALAPDPRAQHARATSTWTETSMLFESFSLVFRWCLGKIDKLLQLEETAGDGESLSKERGRGVARATKRTLSGQISEETREGGGSGGPRAKPPTRQRAVVC